MCEQLEHDTLLVIELHGLRHVLERAAAADASMLAEWLDPLWAGLQDLDHAAFVIGPVHSHAPGEHRLTRQRSSHEMGLAVQARDATSLMAERFDDQFDRFRIRLAA